MKRKISALFLSFLAATFFCGAQVIFDPATFDASNLPDGMKIVDIKGSKYLQVVLNGWNSNLKVPVVKLYDKQVVKCDVKFSMGDRTNDTLTLADIKGVVQIMDTINLVKNPWGEGMVATSVAIPQDPANAEFTAISASSSMKLVHNIQFFGQEKKNWGSTTGDTIWVGKIKAVNANPLIAFDVNQVDTADLADGMSIVEKNGQKYLQVVLDGWNSSIFINPVQVNAGKKAVVEFKYSLSAKTDDTLEMADVKAVIQLMDTINRIANPWGGTGTVPSSTGITQDPVTGKSDLLSLAISKDMKLINQIQFFGQEKKNWGPTKGDTLWVSKVKIVSNDPLSVLDPAEIDPDDLPDGMTIVSIKNEKYIQVILNGWNSNLFLSPVTLKPGYTAEGKIKYSLGDKSNDTLTMAEVKAVVQLMDTMNRIDNPWGEGTIPSATGITQDPVTGTLDAASLAMSTDMKLINQVQFFGQEKNNWGPTTGDTIWVSKITLADKTAPTKPANLTAVVAGKNVSLTWEASTDAVTKVDYIISQGNVVLDTVAELTFTVNDLADGTYKFSIAALDKNGNKSAAVSAEAVINATGINDASVATVTMYPNPATDYIVISNVEKANVQIFNTSGQMVMVKSVAVNEQINVSTLNKGIYMVKVQSANNASIIKLIKK